MILHQNDIVARATRLGCLSLAVREAEKIECEELLLPTEYVARIKAREGF